MKSCRSEIERLIPTLRQVARALVENHRADIADDLVHEALDEAVRGERGWAAGEVEVRLFARLVGANRHRVRLESDARRTLPGLSLRGEGAGSRPAPMPRGGDGHGLDGLALGDREALILTVLAHLDHGRTAEILGIPQSTLIARLTHARDTLGTTLWAAPSTPKARTGGAHLRLVKP